MGWEGRDVGFTVALRLDAHGGETEQRHEQLADELAERLRAAIIETISDPRYAEILLFEPDWYRVE